MFGLFNKAHSNLLVREIVFTFVIEQAEPLGVSGLAEIMIGKKFLPYEFTLKCSSLEITAEEVKKAIESISVKEYIENDENLGKEFGTCCETQIGSIVISIHYHPIDC